MLLVTLRKKSDTRITYIGTVLPNTCSTVDSKYFRKIETDKHYWSMLSIDDHRGQSPRGSEFKGSYKFEFDRSFTKVGSKSAEREELENFISEMLKSPNKAIGFGPTFTSS